MLQAHTSSDTHNTSNRMRKERVTLNNMGCFKPVYHHQGYSHTAGHRLTLRMRAWLVCSSHADPLQIGIYIYLNAALSYLSVVSMFPHNVFVPCWGPFSFCHHHPVYMSHCWIQLSSQNKRANYRCNFANSK